MSKLEDIAADIRIIKACIGGMSDACAEMARIQEELAEHIKSQQPAARITPSEQNELVKDLLFALARKQYIEAIKAHRAITGSLPKDSKNAIEEFYHKLAEYIS